MADTDRDDNPHPMSQDEIDALFDQLAQEVPSQEEEQGRDTGLTVRADDSKSAPPAGQEEADDGTISNLRQSEIDRLVGDIGPRDDDLEDTADEDELEEPAAATEAKSLNQDDIDAVLAEVAEAEPEPESEAEEAEAEPEAAADGPLGQNDIDALLSAMQEDAEPESESEPEAPSDGPLGQHDIDSLLAEMGADGSDETDDDGDDENTGGAGGGMAQGDIDALLREMGAVPEDEDENEDTVDTATQQRSDSTVGDGPLGQTEIDALLSELGGGDADATLAMDPSSEEPDSGRLSTQQINSIIQKQDETAHTEEGEAGDSMISQSDIDALVGQMSMATGSPDRDEIDDLLSEREQDIDALLREVQDKADLSDAVQATMPSAPAPMGQLTLPSGTAVMAPEELRGTRYLLIAAVLLLTMCTVTMVFVAQAINGLTDELYAGRSDELRPQDGYDNDIAVGMELLASDDPVKVTKGLHFFAHMKRQYPARAAELNMLLAKHHRSRSAWRRAVAEYQEIMEQQGAYVDDPEFYLDYSDSLFQLEQYEQAQSVLLRLLANEERFGRAVDEQGRSRPDELVRNEREILQRAYLLLGRLYTARLERLPSVQAEAGRAQL
ncbi:MAG: tetratricopeptide repeat protein [Planctomycetota bacterium]